MIKNEEYILTCTECLSMATKTFNDDFTCPSCQTDEFLEDLTEYEFRVRELEITEDMTTSDAQGVADAEQLQGALK